MEELKIYEDKMNKTLDVLLSDFGTIRAGRANPHVLDKIKVDCDPAVGKEPLKTH